ncbi:MAG TPA: CGNR zinc finger domain-containing protein [Ornithinimicrobium sp.]|uniref:CGNR zinc finger domain-containing protein n=1 Tax=Ornithinimicrobium sp. TaxID=1977084 RepID=UPI002B46B2F8|nr:CGNR zinc finger domain-containing protein [Ornithinimicrobium sp.]HKJ11566.1 CGNR zinc finger domain-containing protein [Ornithinimicrobium sp.]
MVFAHDTEEALIAAAALANTAIEPDSLTTVRELDTFYEECGWKGRHARTAAELRDVRSLRPTLRSLWLAEVEEQVAGINSLLREADALPQVVRHDGFDWHLHATTHDQPLATRMAVEASMAMVDVIRMGETQRLKTCEADGCECIFVDLSRNRSRRYCSTACSNRMAAAAYRERRSESDGEEDGQ